MIPRGLLKTITGMLFELGQDVYSKDFEQPFLQRSADFYKIESNEYLAQNSAPDYMRKAEQRLHEEEDRVSHYLDARTEPKIKEVALALALALAPSPEPRAPSPSATHYSDPRPNPDRWPSASWLRGICGNSQR